MLLDSSISLCGPKWEKALSLVLYWTCQRPPFGTSSSFGNCSFFYLFVLLKKKFIEKTSQKALLSIATEIIKMIASCQLPAVIRLENMSEIKYQLQAEHITSRIKANFSCMYWLKILIPKPGQC